MNHVRNDYLVIVLEQFANHHSCGVALNFVLAAAVSVPASGAIKRGLADCNREMITFLVAPSTYGVAIS
jgi:hypothetical protein